MPRFTSLLFSTSTLSWFRGRRASAVLGWLLLLSYLPLLSNCSYYHSRPKEVQPERLSKLADKKLFLVHQGNSIWQLNNPRLNGEQLEGEKSEVTPQAQPYLNPPRRNVSPRYKGRDEQVVLNIVHLYISDFQPGQASQVHIPLSTIQRLEVLEEDDLSTVLSYIGIPAGVVALLFIIIALTKSSCPFVYAHNGTGYQFVGETYGGAIFAPSERDDYMPLPSLQPTSEGEYLLKISNELRERQYTNLAELCVVEHPDSVRVLLDRRGQPHTLARSLAPVQATAGSGPALVPALAAVDKRVVMFDEPTPGARPNSVLLTFANPGRARQGKLVLRAQNSLWLDYLYGEFTKQFGSYYNDWAATQQHESPQKLQQWALDQGIPLTVSVRTRHGWQVVDHIPPVGPLAYRDLVVPLPLADVAPGPVQVKLETGFMFWEVDYAALDLSPNLPVRLTRCAPHAARDEHGRDQRPALLHDDHTYLRQLQAGTEVRLTYRPAGLPAAAPARRTTAFLHTKGYYEPIRQYQGLPDVTELYSFQRPGRFIEFSKEKYRQSYQQMAVAAK
ncbi:hypothetical protein [Hymenobacter weizhouensis]|uniref:hypothetical protein n=1 Tax=Hymenobacter sp. YIM 151500-1 TaxID=2987689 RepID=UPI002225E4EC|nr:hypothetical protein [Hymenobacter sp. YIM 151500-1]UYZ64359.1 hypothetical protein OIS53_05785 [Hymenobacter sp. YIM 151500-1]